MGIAASEARYLILLARQSDCEFQGQQIQQSILDLSNKSSKLFSEQLDLVVPTVPRKTDFTHIIYIGTDSDDTYRMTDFIEGSETEGYNYTVTYTKNDGEETSSPALATKKSGRFTSITLHVDTTDIAFSSGSNLQVSEEEDTEGYNDAMQQYNYEMAVYDKAYSDIQAQISVINSQDKILEMKLSQLDTERTALKTELESVQKVLKDNVERAFKTFNN